MIQIATRSEILKCLLCSYLPQSSFQSLSSTSWRSRTERKKTDQHIVSCHSWIAILPTIIFISLLVFHFEFLRSFSTLSSFNFLLVMDLLFFTNSLINPIMYAVRMPKLGECNIKSLQSNSVDFPLRNLSSVCRFCYNSRYLKIEQNIIYVYINRFKPKIIGSKDPFWFKIK